MSYTQLAHPFWFSPPWQTSFSVCISGCRGLHLQDSSDLCSALLGPHWGAASPAFGLELWDALWFFRLGLYRQRHLQTRHQKKKKSAFTFFLVRLCHGRPLCKLFSHRGDQTTSSPKWQTIDGSVILTDQYILLFSCLLSVTHPNWNTWDCGASHRTTGDNLIAEIKVVVLTATLWRGLWLRALHVKWN